LRLEFACATGALVGVTAVPTGWPILPEMFEAVYMDTDAKQIVGVRPYAEFVPMFRQTPLVERDWQFVLENEMTAQESDSTERSYVLYGSDGGRIIVKLSCWSPHSRLTRLTPFQRVRDHRLEAHCPTLGFGGRQGPSVLPRKFTTIKLSGSHTLMPSSSSVADRERSF
jgi:hypothetical protein